MRNITHIVVHCTGASQNQSVESIKKYWKEVRKWSAPGYHFLIKKDGEVVQLQHISEPSNGVANRNSSLINVCYIGGVDAFNKSLDNRTPAQKASLLNLLGDLHRLFPGAIIQGHRDFPEVKKDCPCFDARKEYANL
jgi:N-acetylmuramoyl-L-alanine amidase